MRKQALVIKGNVRTQIDLSALYPSDPLRPLRPRAKKHKSDTDCAGGDHCEKKAVREAIEGWRWL